MKRRGAAFLTLGALCAILALGSGVVTAAAAVAKIESVFELDGNVAHNSATLPPCDWENVVGNATACPAPTALMGGLTGTTGVIPDSGASDSSFTGGSKDTLDISSWHCTSKGPNAKDNLFNSYLATFSADNSTGDVLLYLGQERASNNGDAFGGFWLLQGTASCNTSVGNWVGAHVPGDLLVQTNFIHGGGTAVVTHIYQWTATGLSASALFTNAGCTGSLTDDPSCSVVNGSDISPSWDSSAVLAPPEFAETGIDLTQFYSAHSLGSIPCTFTVISETRESQSFDAELGDYVAPTAVPTHASNCVAPPVPSPTPSPSPSASTQPVSVGSTPTPAAAEGTTLASTGGSQLGFLFIGIPLMLLGFILLGLSVRVEVVRKDPPRT